MLLAVDRKVLRDVVRMRSQLLAIALVIASGFGMFVTMRGTMRSLQSARDLYYAQERFGEVFAGLTRAPEWLAQDLRDIPGVRQVQTRVVTSVTMDVPGMREAVRGQLLSLPDRGRPAVNDIFLRAGRMPEPGREEEALANEAFMKAHDFSPGTTVGAVINGRWKELRIVGTAMSPEYAYSLPPGSLFPDDERFGVFWLRREGLASALDMEGAFNSVSFLLDPGVSADRIIEGVDRVLRPYGGLGAFPRKDQQSAFFIDNELRQLATFAFLVPIMFLGVAAFLLNIVVGRIVADQREQVAALKALGYSDGAVGVHFAKMVGLVVLAGALLGFVLMGWMGSFMTSLYMEFYSFPDLPFRPGASEVLLGLAITLAAAALGTWAAIRRVIQLPPAEALRPKAPPAYRPTVLERAGLSHLVSPPARIILRELERKPLRAGLSLMGIAMATALTVFNSFTLDSIQYLLNLQFGITQRQDVTLTLSEPRELAVLSELEHLPGVGYAEPWRSVPVRLRSGHRSRDVGITGVPAGSVLDVLLDTRLRRVPIPPRGLVLSRKLSEILRVGVGDEVLVEVLEGRRPTLRVPVARIAETFMGLGAHMNLETLCAHLGEAPTLSGARLLMDEARLEDLHREVKRTPMIAGISTRDNDLSAIRELLDEGLGTWVTISMSFSLILAFGILYNAVRITLAERARELASLRVLGFRRREVASILFGELSLLTFLALPLGLVLGRLMAQLMVNSPGFDNEQFRIPLVIHSDTYALAVTTVLVAGVISAWAAWKRLDRMDLVEVLKTRD